MNKALFNDLRTIFTELRKKLLTELDRAQPVGDHLSDRWEKATALGFGNKTSIYDSSYVYGDVSVGKNTWIGPFTVLDGSGGLTIGSNCSISAGVQIYTHDSVHWAVSGGMDDYEYASTTIGDNCYIGPNSIISKGVRIGDGCVIGANSFVREDIPDNTKAAGSPSKPIGNTSEDKII